MVDNRSVSQPVPRPGPLALLPQESPFFADAVRAAGGTVTDLDEATRGILWLSNSGPDVLAEALSAHPGVGWVQLPWAGIDAFADTVAEFGGRGVVFTSAKGAYARPVAEHALACILALLRGFPVRLRARSWGEKFGRTLYGARVVIVGAGGIALELMRLLEPFKTTVTIVRRSSEPVPGAARTITLAGLNDALADADVVVLAAALTPDTRHLMGRDELAAMLPHAVLVNVARGGLVDTAALVETLDAEGIAGAALDVTDPEPLPDGHPLWQHPLAIITPHSADTPEMTKPLLAERIEVNVRSFLAADGQLLGIVDTRHGY